MKKIFAILVLALAVCSCQKPYVTTLDLAVDYYPDKGIIVTTPEAGRCNIHITSSGSWTSYLDSDCTWARLEDASGSGIGYVRFVYDENVSSEDRTVIFTVSGSGKTISFPITQTKVTDL